MSIRFYNSIAAVAAAALLVFAPANAQTPTAKSESAPAIPRMANGKPDFSGVWDHPRVADVAKNAKGCGSESKGCTQEGAGPLPLTDWGMTQFKNPNKFDYSGHCQPWGYTRAWQTEYPVEIIQTPQRLAILWESNNVFHVVPTDGRDHPKDMDPTWMGNSVGKWDGDTLVIDTVGFNGKTWVDNEEHPLSEQMHIVERMHYVDGDHVAYEVTWEDPKAYTKPFKNVRTFARMKPGSEIMEWWCMENNKDLLEGHLDGKVRK